MSMNLGPISASLELRADKWRRELEGARAQLTSFRKSLNGLGMTAVKLNQSFELMRNGMNLLKGAIQGTLGALIETADQADRWRITLNTLLGSSREGGKMFQDMANYAASVPYTFQEIMQSATALSGVMKGGREEVGKWIPIIGDLAAVGAASGISFEETTTQILRMYSAGAASADLFREKGITQMLGFTPGVQYTAEETRKGIEDAYNAVNSKFRGLTDELSKTWGGTMSMLRDQLFLFELQVMNSGLFDTMKMGALEFLGSIKRLKAEGRLDDWAKDVALGVVTSFQIMSESVGFFAESVNAVAYTWNSFWEKYHRNDLKRLQKDFNMYFDLYEKASKNTAENPFPNATKEDISGINAARDQLNKLLGDSGNASKWRETPELLADLNAQIQDLQVEYNDSADAVSRNIERHERFNDLLNKIRETLGKTKQDIIEYQGSIFDNKGGPDLPRLGTYGGMEKEDQAVTTAKERLQRMYNDVWSELQKIGVSPLEQEMIDVVTEAENLKVKMNDAIEKNPAIEEMIDQLSELKMKVLEAGQSFEVVQLKLNTWADMMKSTLSAMQQPLADFFQSFADEGSASLKDLGQALADALRASAAQLTAQLLMQAAYHTAMIWADPYNLMNNKIPHATSALVAAQAAAIMGSFVVGSGLAGMAHDGISNIPEDGTWLLKKNERVVDPETNSDLKEFLKNGGGQGANITQNITINGGDEAGILKALPEIKNACIDAVSESYATGGKVYQTIQNYR